MNQTHYELLQPHHQRLLWLGSAIALLSFFDFMAFWYGAEVLAQLFFTEHGPGSKRYLYIGAAFAAGYLARPIGGLLLGNYGDRYGRKPAMLLSFFSISLFTFIIAVLPTYNQFGKMATLLFVLARIGQGMAFGNQLPVLWTYITEQLPVSSIGLGCGLMTAATLGGNLLLLGLLGLLDTLLTQTQMLAFGWRLPFLLGATLGLVVLYFAKSLPETPIFLSHRQKRQQQKPKPLPTKQRWQGLMSVLVLSWFVSSLVTVVIILLPDLVNLIFVLNNGLFGSAFVICLIFLVFGCVLFGILTDRFNAGLVISAGCVAFLAAFFLAFYDLSTGGGSFVLITLALTGLFGGIIGAMPVVMVRLCPVQHRLRTLAVGYNSVYALSGALTPLLLGFLTYYADFTPVLYLSFVGMITVFFSSYVYYHPRTASAIGYFDSR